MPADDRAGYWVGTFAGRYWQPIGRAALRSDTARVRVGSFAS